MHFTRDDNLFEDFTVGETLIHPRGRTVSDEHMIWTNVVLNTAQLHFNQKMCDDSPGTTFNGRRVVYGGIVFAFVAGLASEETEEMTRAGTSIPSSPAIPCSRRARSCRRPRTTRASPSWGSWVRQGW